MVGRFALRNEIVSDVVGRGMGGGNEGRGKGKKGKGRQGGRRRTGSWAMMDWN
jgi:hypothetical protein